MVLNKFLTETVSYHQKNKNLSKYKPIFEIKSNRFLNLISGCASLGSKNYNEVFAITGDKSFTSPWKNFDPLLFAEQFFNTATLVFQHEQPVLVMPKHLNRISIGCESRL